MGRMRVRTASKDGLPGIQIFQTHVIERLVDNKNSVVDHRPYQNDEAQHGEDVERLSG